MKKILMIGAAAALLAVGSSAQAQIALNTDYTAYLTQPGEAPAQPDLQVVYNVGLSGSIYTYTYTFTVGNYNGTTFTPTTANPVSSFTVDASYVLAASSGGVIGAGDVVWNFNPALNSDTVSLTSDYGPTLGDASGNDGSPGVSWSSVGVGGDQVAVPSPVPEASTVMAGALMLLPLGIGAVRALRKERVA